MSFMVKIYRLFLASPFDFFSAMSYLTEAAIICQKKWRQIEGGTFCLSTPENKRGPDLGLTVGSSHRSQFMISHMRQLSLLKKPSDVTGPCSLHPSMSLPSVQCPLLTPVAATGPFLDTTAAHENQPVSCMTGAVFCTALQKLPTQTLSQRTRQTLFLPNKRGDGVGAQTGGRCS